MAGEIPGKGSEQAEKDLGFAIVCDSGCDLPTEFLEKIGVECVQLRTAPTVQDLAADLRTAYRLLAARGYARVASVHSSACFSPAIEDARGAALSCKEAVRVEVVDSGSASVATGMVVDRISRYRSLGMAFDEAVDAARAFAAHVRLLVVPSASAKLARRRHHLGSERSVSALVSRATTSLRARLSGERGLYLVARGEVTRLARATDLVELTSRLAHAMSSVAAGEGPITYALLETGDPRARRAVEKPLDTNEFESRCLGTVRATPAVEAVVGAGAVGAGLVPDYAYERGATDRQE